MFLSFAVYSSCKIIYRWLLDHTDIDLTLRAKKGETVFHVAAAQGSMKTMEVTTIPNIKQCKILCSTLQVLVSHDVNLKDFISTSLDDSCFTALHLAIIRQHNHIVRYIYSPPPIGGPAFILPSYTQVSDQQTRK